MTTAIKDEAQQISKFFVYDAPLKLYIDFINYQREMGQWAVYYTSPQSFIIRFLICWLNNFGDFSEF